MKKELLQQATNLAENRKRKKGWQRFVQMLALCVVFCTTYLLILPAITIQEKPICGHAEHTHTDQCSMTPRAELVNCGILEGTLALHRHEALCFDESGALICSLPERLAHTHGEDCWTVTEIPCTEPIPQDHVHTEECYLETRTLTCTRQELGLHSHTESCYEGGPRLAAGTPWWPTATRRHVWRRSPPSRS